MLNKLRINSIQRSLLKQLVITDFKLRYQGSILGYFWSLFKPLMMFGVLYVVFTYIIPTGKGVPHFPAYLLLGIVVWTFFVESTSMGLGSIVGRGDLIKKVSVSKISIVFASVLSAGINFLLNMVIVIIFMLASGVEITWIMFPFLLFLITEIILLALGAALILSALYVKFRDFAPIWEIILQVMFYATPIIYPLTLIATNHHRITEILSLNPVAQIIQDLRRILITPATLTTHDVLPVLLSYVQPISLTFVVLIIGLLYFNKRSKYFVEEL
jgi:ABC-2 type transport system permease protein